MSLASLLHLLSYNYIFAFGHKVSRVSCSLHLTNIKTRKKMAHRGVERQSLMLTRDQLEDLADVFKTVRTKNL